MDTESSKRHCAAFPTEKPAWWSLAEDAMAARIQSTVQVALQEVNTKIKGIEDKQTDHEDRISRL